MRTFSILAKRKIRNISWVVRPLFLAIDAKYVMYFIIVCCVTGLIGTIL
jgi:hypothetical protein